MSFSLDDIAHLPEAREFESRSNSFRQYPIVEIAEVTDVLEPNKTDLFYVAGRRGDEGVVLSKTKRDEEDNLGPHILGSLKANDERVFPLSSIGNYKRVSGFPF